MGICAVFGCTNNHKKNLKRTPSERVSLYRFPSEPFRSKWIQFCKRKDNINLTNARICSIHFTQEDRCASLKNRLLGLAPAVHQRQLKPDAIPTLHGPKARLLTEEQIQLKRNRAKRLDRRVKRQIVRSVVTEIGTGTPNDVPMEVGDFGEHVEDPAILMSQDFDSKAWDSVSSPVVEGDWPKEEVKEHKVDYVTASTLAGDLRDSLGQFADSMTTGSIKSTSNEIVSGSGASIKIYSYWQEDLELAEEKPRSLDKVPSHRDRGAKRRNKLRPTSLVGAGQKSVARYTPKKNEATDGDEQLTETGSSGESVHGHECLDVTSKSDPMQRVTIKEEPTDGGGEEAGANEVEETKYSLSLAGSNGDGLPDISSSESNVLQVAIKEEPIEDIAEGGGGSSEDGATALDGMFGESPRGLDTSNFLQVGIKEHPDPDDELPDEVMPSEQENGRIQQDHHNPPLDKKYTCRLCGRKYSKVKHLEQHTRTHYGETAFFECGFCEYKFNLSEDLETHMRTHTGDLPFECDICDCKCSQQGQLEIHVMNSHFPCDSRPAVHIEASDLKIHVTTHTCEVCGYECAREDQMETHKRTHYACDLCDYKCTGDQLEIEIHMKTHYNCSLCEYRCSKISDLKAHMKRHLGKHRKEKVKL